MIKVIIFDFDGVIVDSNDVKTDAFIRAFKDRPLSIKDAIRRFHLENGGMSRFDTFRHIYVNILKEPLSEQKFKELCSDFSRFVIEGVLKAPLFEGVQEFLEKNKNRYAVYIVSGTPELEIREIAKKRGLDRYFLAIYGSPRSKKELIDSLVSEKGYRRSEVLFLGDSINDYEGAEAAGVEFVAKIDRTLGIEQFSGINLKARIETMAEFEEYLERRNGN